MHCKDDDNLLQTVTIELTDSNNIHFPFEWFTNLNIGFGYVQITLVGNRIVIHKPTVANVKYNAPCKAGENSYIRSLNLFSIRVPKQLLLQLDIKDGDKADLILEENCISIYKHIGDNSEAPVSEAQDPLMAFCCVCTKLLYTENFVNSALKSIKQKRRLSPPWNFFYFSHVSWEREPHRFLLCCFFGRNGGWSISAFVTIHFTF